MRDWKAAKLKYETTECTQQDIADELECSRQCVHNHVKKEGWLKFTGIDEIRGDNGQYLSVQSDEKIASIIDTYALTGNKTMACEQAGIDDKTLFRWCEDEPDLALTLRVARQAHLIGQYRKIANAKDWKAAKEILARAPETKEQWGDIQEKGPTIVLNIHRDEVIIEG